MHFNRYVQSSIPAGASEIEIDVLVIGTGIAGLSAALAASEQGRVLVACKGELHNSNEWYAQGGIAVPTQDPHDTEAHIEDTLRVACGLADLEIVKYVIQRAPAAIEKLIARGMAFDRDGGVLARTREGGHSRTRVLHARGDATGLELGATLAEHVRPTPNIHVIQFCLAEDLMTCGGRCAGATGWLNNSERAVIPRAWRVAVWAKSRASYRIDVDETRAVKNTLTPRLRCRKAARPHRANRKREWNPARAVLRVEVGIEPEVVPGQPGCHVFHRLE